MKLKNKPLIRSISDRQFSRKTDGLSEKAMEQVKEENKLYVHFINVLPNLDKLIDVGTIIKSLTIKILNNSSDEINTIDKLFEAMKDNYLYDCILTANYMNEQGTVQLVDYTSITTPDKSAYSLQYCKKYLTETPLYSGIKIGTLMPSGSGSGIASINFNVNYTIVMSDITAYEYVFVDTIQEI